MYLLGDIGNTEIKICLVNSNYKILKKIILKTNSISYKYLDYNFSFFLKYSKRIQKILFSSVVPIAFKKIKLLISKKFKKKVFELKEININNLIQTKVNKKQVGSDRIANTIGAINNKENFIVVDFGTATTFDVIIKNKYLGGIIAPGINLSLKTLSKKAYLIPKINFSKVKKVIGTNTSSAVKSGFFWGYCGLINNIIKLISR
ncbi:MAG: type III pantothenate kinase, partial [Euryarchaeota archaeon]|nr:type III pantothenate kinase [Euryarchaeota archaeon]